MLGHLLKFRRIPLKGLGVKIWGCVFPKFSAPPSGETIRRPTAADTFQRYRYKNGTDLLFHHVVWWGWGSHIARHRPGSSIQKRF